MKISDTGERALVKRLAEQVKAGPQVIKGIGDDTAVLPFSGGEHLLYTTDMLVEGVHFSLSFSSLFQVGKKCIAVNASDTAAMGGSPSFAVVSLALPPSLTPGQVDELYRGLLERAGEYGITIVGGDTVQGGEIVVNTALLGTVTAGKAVYRDGAAEGDLVYVTGSLGKSAAGLYVCTHPELPAGNPALDFALEYHLEPAARVEEGKRLGEAGVASAMNDISDGLATEVMEICSASNKGCRIDLDAVPVAPQVKEIAGAAARDCLDWALYGGEDFELVFTISPEQKGRAEELFREFKLPVTLIGEILAPEEGIYGIDSAGRKIRVGPGGYEHFQ